VSKGEETRRPGDKETRRGRQFARSRLCLLVFSSSSFLVCLLCAARAYGGDAADAGAAEFFEKEIRPILAEKCHQCHGSGKVRGGLHLTGREQMLKGGDSGPAVVPGKPERSLLVRAIEYQGELKMPPKGKLSDAQIARLKRWIAMGVPWADASKAAVVQTQARFAISDEQRRFWAFQTIRPVPPAEIKDKSWPRAMSDRFILAELEARSIAHAEQADKRTLLRRATFDLTGLPPTPEETEAFLRDDSPEAFARVVDRLLASPAYGERWARHWLDVARYADYYQADPHEHGSANKFELFEAYRYRDWVVEAFNRDLPYDQFVRLQIAGDLLPGPKGEAFYPEGRIATAFLALGSWDHGDADKDKLVSDIVDDQIDTVGKAFLGLTLGCARCHNHKFDPISQEDYYGLAGIFYSTHILANVGAKGDHSVIQRVPLASPEYVRKREEQVQQFQKLDRQRTRLSAEQAAQLIAAPSPLARLVACGYSLQLAKLKQRREATRQEMLPPPPVALGAQEGGTPGGLFTGIQDVPLHIRGSYTRLGAKVPRRLPVLFAGDQQPPITRGSGRLEVAEWISAKDNPLTARVLVNRVWQQHFGEGIVRTPSNFGKLGEAPTHPALLDWLAARFMEDGWSIKALHRRIMLSAAYQQASTVSPQMLAKDPNNRWFGRMNARRLEAEAIRDAMLSVAGRLERRQGGPAGLDLDKPRRSLYVQTTRWDRNNFSTLFDAANPDQSTETRTISTVAPQALFLLNDAFVWNQAKRLAERLRGEAPDDAGRIDRACQLLFGRPPREEERSIGKAFLDRVSGRGSDDTWTDYLHVLLCSNEFVYLD
jgi:Protein of unknown function (DUF1553)/Protein of unknown function (DUF1549)/Planctomycete cytochrome C